VDAGLEVPEDLVQLAFPVMPLLERMRAKVAVSLVFLDACRDDPFKLEQRGRTAGTKQVIVKPAGLAAIPETELQDALIAFAAEQGKTAADGEPGGLSPFTKALSEHIGSPGLEIIDMMREVKKSVRNATQKKQTPWSNDSLTHPFYFNPTKITRPLVKAKQDVEDAVNPGGKKREPDKVIGVAKRLEDIEESHISQEIPSDLRTGFGEETPTVTKEEQSPPPSSATAASLEAVPDGSVEPNHIDTELAPRVTHLRITRSKNASKRKKSPRRPTFSSSPLCPRSRLSRSASKG
jgi:caspase domain-containing protein